MTTAKLRDEFIWGFDDGPDDREHWYNLIIKDHDKNLIKKIEQLNLGYTWCDDGFDPDVPYGKHLDECERHYQMAKADIITLIKGEIC